ncbi:CRE-PTR-23 protein [Aphelenchoides avenae]|nr:CRE-PTR-23 protein [Aphelenchus avenae]
MNNIKGYAPYGSRSLNEFAVREEFFDQNGVGIRVFVLVIPKNGTNMLTEENLKEAVEVDEIVQNNLTIYNHVTKRDEPFSQVCRRFCKINQPVHMFYQGFKHQKSRLRRGEKLNDKINLSYPISTLYDRQMNIQPNFFGIHFRNETVNKTDDNDALARKITSMNSVEMVVLLYRAERHGGWTDLEIKNYEMSISKYFKNEYKSKNLHVMTISTSYVESEVDRAGKTIMPYVGVGLTVMMVCSVVTVALSALYMQQFTLYKIPLAAFGCVCPFMASGTALGLLFFAGVRYGSILAVCPFLIIAIGVDDAFLMIHAWQRVSKRMQRDAKVEDTVANRLSMVLVETGPAILISALTNIFADAVGSFTGSPEITLLCIGNISCIVVDFFYQITLYSAIMAIVGQREMEREKQNAIAYTGGENASNDSDSGKSSTSFHDAVKAKFTAFIAWYVKMITNVVAASLLCLFWIAFLAVGFNAMLKFEINLTTSKLFPRDSPLLEIEHYRENFVLPFYTTAQVFVNNPGNLSDPVRRSHLNHLVEDMEALSNAYPAESSNYFLRDFEIFESLQHSNNDDVEVDEAAEEDPSVGSNTTAIAADPRKEDLAFSMNDLPEFLQWPEYDWWKGLLKYHQEGNATVLDAIMINIAFHGEELKDWYKRAQMLREWRQVVDRYKNEFNVSVLHDDGLYLDLLENMPTDIWQSAVATLLCMAAICAIFMANFFSVVVATLVIASIMLATLGIMALQGMTMDPIVMAAIIISIGFSVDIPAHVSYHFHEAGKMSKGKATVQDRLRHALSSVGYPAVQASFSTNICILCLLLVPLYMAHVFVRVMCLCITLCAFHSLVLLPAVFTVLSSITSLFRRLTGRRRKTSYSPNKVSPAALTVS